MPGFTGDLDVDLERGLAECASKPIMTHILEKGFHGQRKMIKVHIQAVAEIAQVSSKEETCWLAIAAATAWLPAPEHTMAASLAADEDRYLEYAGPDIPGESVEDKQARLTQAMNRASEEVFAELVTPNPASQGEPDPDAGGFPGDLAVVSGDVGYTGPKSKAS